MEINEKQYAKIFKEIVSAEFKIKEGLDELTKFTRKMENDYRFIFPQYDNFQLLRDAGIIGEKKNTNK